MKLIFCLFILATSVLSISAQNTDYKGKFVVMPSDRVLLVMVNQPECPLKIEDAKYLYNINANESKIAYKLHNTSNKKISGFVLSNWHIGGGGGDLNSISTLLLPNQNFWLGDEKNSNLIPFDENLAKTLGLKNEKMITVITLMVKEVWFTDGTTYKDSKTYENFLKFLDILDVPRNNSK